MCSVRCALVASIALAALPACFSPVAPPVGSKDDAGSLPGAEDAGSKPGADAGVQPGADAGAVACAKDEDCPQPPSTPCAPVAASCDDGRCGARALPTVWQDDPGACEVEGHCLCQDLDGPDCEGDWRCAAGRCSFECSRPGCESDLDCPTGESCFTDCLGSRSCRAGCHDSIDCPAGKVCYLPEPTCGEPVGACQDAPGCTSDEECPAGSVCDFSDLDGTQRSCRAGCHLDSQCAEGEICAILMCANCPDCPCYGQCQQKDGCQSDVECPAGMVCATEWGRCEPHCLPGCRSDQDCRPDQGCAPPPPCVGCGCDHGTCYDLQAGCSSNSECAAGKVCAYEDVMGCTGERRCVSGCLEDGDCGADETCQLAFCGPCCPGDCVPKVAECHGDAECGPGEICEGCGPTGPRSCMTGCRDNSDCGQGQICEQVVCGTCPCPAQCVARPAGCTSDAECGPGKVCEAGPGCSEPNLCVAGCHDDAQCPGGGVCDWPMDCLTCPCPGHCSYPSCVNQPGCSSGLECAWGYDACTDGCCQSCPVPVPPPCSPTECTHPGGRDVDGCDLGPLCGACCSCAGGSPVCGENYATYGSECEATCVGVQVLHQGPCLPYEGLGCGWSGAASCAQGQYCRNPCPMCASVQQLRCTQIGACVYDWDCPGGLASPTCADGAPPVWSCSNHSCLASCPP